MSLKCGILGLPNVGKSTIFNIIMNIMQAQAENYPFCTIDPNIGKVEVKDKRLNALAELVGSEKIIYTTLEIYDIAGLVRGASKGEGLGNQFLANIRDVDALIHVVRCFDDNDVIHVYGDVNPLRDIEIINLELLYADINTILKRRESIKKRQSNDEEIAVLDKCYNAAQDGIPLRTINLNATELKMIDHLNLLTLKDVLYVANVSESGINGNKYVEVLQSLSAPVLVLCASIEEQMLNLSDEEKNELLMSFGIKHSALDQLILAAYKLLKLITFFTVGPKEARAWDVPYNSNAVDASARIHTDFAKGFIKAETISFDDFIASGGRNEAKNLGKLRYEGKDYCVQDGDILNFMFNV